VTSDLRAAELIKDHFSTKWHKLCPDVPCAIKGPPAPRYDAEMSVHVEVAAEPPSRRMIGIDGWIYVRCWVPQVLQMTGTAELHRAVREILDDKTVASDDGEIAIGEGERFDVGREIGWWMSAVTFPFRLTSK
jgi:hypothetical protein